MASPPPCPSLPGMLVSLEAKVELSWTNNQRIKQLQTNVSCLLMIMMVVSTMMMKVKELILLTVLMKVEELSPSNLPGTWTSRGCEQWPGPKVHSCKKWFYLILHSTFLTLLYFPNFCWVPRFPPFVQLCFFVVFSIRFCIHSSSKLHMSMFLLLSIAALSIEIQWLKLSSASFYWGNSPSLRTAPAGRLFIRWVPTYSFKCSLIFMTMIKMNVNIVSYWDYGSRSTGTATPFAHCHFSPSPSLQHLLSSGPPPCLCHLLLRLSFWGWLDATSF